MKKFFLTLVFALVAMVAVQAQQISVVATNGATTLYRTLTDAINGAQPGSVIYLPGGGFTIADDVKITKKLTIIGIGHYVKGDNDNVDGNTTIGGNLWFNDNSSGSAVMGCYITGNVVIGEDGTAVNDVLIRYCNLNAVDVRNNLCMETIVNQNYIRGGSNFGGCNPTISNNILCSIYNVNGGKIYNNIINSYYGNGRYDSWCIRDSYNSIIKNNIFTPRTYTSGNYDYHIIGGTNNTIEGNMGLENIGYNCINLGEVDWNDVFKKYNGGAISTTSDFHFSENYSEYETKYGIYAGTSFKDEQMAPVPYITYKSVDQETDAQGKLHVKIRVSANR